MKTTPSIIAEEFIKRQPPKIESLLTIDEWAAIEPEAPASPAIPLVILAVVAIVLFKAIAALAILIYRLAIALVKSFQVKDSIDYNVFSPIFEAIQ
jgi:hypothetical protein